MFYEFLSDFVRVSTFEILVLEFTKFCRNTVSVLQALDAIVTVEMENVL